MADSAPTPRRSTAWVRLRKRLSRKGVVEVDIDHHRYKMLNKLRHGIRDLMINHTDLGPKKELSREDYNHVHVKELQTRKGKKYTFTSYSSAVFASLRQAVDLKEEDYLNELAPPDLPYMEFMSNSRSGQDFYLSNSQQYILKTERKHNIDIFQSFLLEYLDHFQMYPHSLIVKFLGIYALEGPGLPKIYFLSMQNIFYPPERIDVRYDIKGCFKNRYQKPNPPDSNILTILKDKNFKHETIDMGVQKGWFVKQLQIDVEFLCNQGVQDYSLLIGQHQISGAETHPTMGDLVLRVKKSYSTPKDLPHHTNDLNSESKDTTSNERKGSLPGEVDQQLKIETAKNHVRKSIYTVPDFLQSSGNADFQNRRLLLNCKNTLHVINGSEHRYYLGIIDFFTKYECRQRFARVLKTLKYFSSDHSTVPPDDYAERFLTFITKKTTES